MKKIAIAFPGDVTDPRPWSGTPFGIYTALQKKGYEVVPINVAPPAKVGSAMIRLIKLFRPSSKLLKPQTIRLTMDYVHLMSAFATAKVLKSKPDLIIMLGTGYRIYTNTPTVTLEDMTIKQILENSWDDGWHLATEEIKETRIALQKKNYELAQKVCLATDWAQDSVIKDYGISPAKTQVVGFGSAKKVIDPRTFAVKDWSTPKFIFIGNDWERKNGDRVIQGFKAVKEKYPDAELNLIGQFERPADLPSSVNYLGYLPLDDQAAQMKLQNLIAESTCLVVPSILEPAGLVYIEAAYAGLPSIGTSIGGASYMIGDAGIVVDPYSQTEITDAMLTLADPETARAFGERGLKRSAEFTWDKVVERLLEQK